MRRFFAARLLQAVSVVFLVTTLTFVLVHVAPGDPFSEVMTRPGVPASVHEDMRRSFGLDRPIGEQYVRWIVNVSRGDLGYSFSHRRPVRDVLRETMPRTLLLAGLAMVLSFTAGIAIAVLQAEHVGSARDRMLGRIFLLLYSVPDFWLALVILLLFAYRIPIFPPGGMVDPVLHEYMSGWGQLADRLRHLVLPVVTLTLLSIASVARYQRAALLEILPSDWMRTAMAKGLSWEGAVRRHALRNALIPAITLAGLALPLLAAGAVFVERVFSWPGAGLATVNGVAARDYPLVTAGVLVISLVVVVGTLVTDLALAAADPRIRLR